MCDEVQPDYYATLGVTQDAGADAIKRAYRKLALLRHPDKNPDNPNAGVEFRELHEAYEFLCDDARRTLYDSKYTRIRAAQDHQRKEKAEQEKAKNKRAKRETRERERVARARVRVEEIEKLRLKVKKTEGELVWMKDATVRNGENPGWWTYIWGGKETEEEKLGREQERLQKVAGARIKTELLQREKIKLKRLEEEHEKWAKVEAEARAKDMREELERLGRERAERLGRERAERLGRERAERLGRERAERLREQQRQKEKEQREKEQREKAEKERQSEREEERREQELRERQAAQAEEARKTRERLAQELRERVERQRGEQRQQQQRHREPQRTRRARRTPTSSSSYNDSATCRHLKFWPKVEGDHQCSVCKRHFRAWILRCPDCGVRACAGCKVVLRTG
ncbi:MAG: hypothetical protein M1840_005122 [Geoglossum simile]|nr:MAG: hypothetical protein M1840_005122 [Geoglossum simile]